MGFAFSNPQPPWNTATQLWLLEQSQAGRTQQEVYDDLTAETSSTRPDIVPRWVGKFGTFKKRYQRLCRNGSDLQSATGTDDMPDFDLATVRGRYNYWVYLAQNTNSLATRTQALVMIEKLAPQFVNEDTEEDRMTIAERRVRGNFLLNDPHAFTEVVSMQLAEWLANGHTEEVISLLANILNLLPTQDKIEAIKRATDTTLIPQLLADETSEQRVMRLCVELKGLSTEEQEQIEHFVDEITGNKGE